ncbi:MAG: hypothetical protein QM785_15690 [Pyrinomonadaceae bacterium]
MAGDETRPNRSENELDEDICIHIFTASAALVGVCLTVIGIFQIGSLKAIGSFADNLLAIDALCFLISCIVSYAALRTKAIKRRQRLERLADSVFITALSLMAVVCFLIAYELL